MAVVNEYFVRRLMPELQSTAEAVGKRFSFRVPVDHSSHRRRRKGGQVFQHRGRAAAVCLDADGAGLQLERHHRRSHRKAIRKDCLARCVARCSRSIQTCRSSTSRR